MCPILCVCGSLLCWWACRFDLDRDFVLVLSQTISEVFRAAGGDAEMGDWTGFLAAASTSMPSVVLHDRLMTDAALGAAALGAAAGAPIKTEHSYCSLDSADMDANGDADADSNPDSEMTALSASMDGELNADLS